MDAFRAQFERVRQQLAVLTATQKMLVTALVAVIVMTMLYWGHYAANQDMVPVMEMTLADDALNPIVHFLDAHGISHSVANGQVLVPADRKTEVLSQLAYEELLPSDTRSVFEDMGNKTNMFTSASDHEAMYNHVTEVELSNIINHWPGVTHAWVKINSKSEERLEGSIKPSASVGFTCKADGDRVQQTVQAAADNVAHAVSDLTPDRISVVVNGISRHVSGHDDVVTGADYMGMVAKNESRLEQKVLEDYGKIPNLTVTVTCEIENSTHHTTEHIVDKANTYNEPAKVSEKTSETITAGAASQVPGVDPNTGANQPASIDGGGGGAGQSSTNTSETETVNQIIASGKDVVSDTPAGKPTVVSATVCVPRSYFVSLYKSNHPDVSTPAEDQFAPLRATELAKIQKNVKLIVGLKDDSAVAVSEYLEMPTELAAAPAATTASAALTQVSGHAKEIGIGLLAMVSLFMMSSMVKRSTPAPVLMAANTSASGATGSSFGSLNGAEILAGDASSAALDGMELDDDAVRTQQMLDQVTTMVQQNPDGAAALVKRWLSRP